MHILASQLPQKNEEELVFLKYLEDAGVDPNLKDLTGSTALELLSDPFTRFYGDIKQRMKIYFEDTEQLYALFKKYDFLLIQSHYIYFGYEFEAVKKLYQQELKLEESSSVEKQKFVLSDDLNFLEHLFNQFKNNRHLLDDDGDDGNEDGDGLDNNLGIDEEYEDDDQSY